MNQVIFPKSQTAKLSAHQVKLDALVPAFGTAESGLGACSKAVRLSSAHSLMLIGTFLLLMLGRHARADELLFGHIGAHTGVQATTGKGLRDGIALYFDFLNASGGVKGSRLVLEAIDDQYDAVKTVDAARKLLADPKVIALLATLGTENNNALVKSRILEGTSLINFGARAATSVLEPSQETYRVRASYASEMKKIISHLSVVGATQLGLVSQGDGLGREGEEALLKALGAGPAKLVVKHSYDRASSDVSGSVAAMRAASLQAIVFVGISKACADFIQQYHKQGGGAAVYALSVVDPNVVAKLAPGAGSRGLIVTQTMPGSSKKATPLIREIQQAIKTTGRVIDVNYTSVEGFAVAKAAVEVLKRSPVATRDGFRNVLVKPSREIDLGGLTVNFSNGKRDGGEYVELSVIGADGMVRN
jgi:branched-chain amino acid transport system substrate-binding protein